MNQFGLTKQQHLLLKFLREREEQALQAPSLEEMARAIGLKAKSSALRIVMRLEERDYLVRKAVRARSVRLVHHRHPGEQRLRDVLIARLADMPAGIPLTPIQVMELIRATP